MIDNEDAYWSNTHVWAYGGLLKEYLAFEPKETSKIRIGLSLKRLRENNACNSVECSFYNSVL